MFVKGGPKSGTPLPEWTISDDGLGMLTGTLKVFIDGNSGMSSGGSTSMIPQSAGAGSLFDTYSGNNGLMNPNPPATGGGLGSGVPKTGDKHPFDGRLTCFGVSVSRNSMGYGYADAQYVGLMSDPAGIEWEITCPTEEDSIETHPSFLTKKLVAVDKDTNKEVSDATTSANVSDFGVTTKTGINPQTKGPYWNLSNVHVDGPTQSFKGFRASDEIIKKRLVGVESYKVTRATYRVSFTTSNISIVQPFLSSLGMIFQTIPPFLNKGIGSMPAYTGASTNTTVTASDLATSAGNAFVAGGKANFLLTSASVSQASGLYKVSVEWTRSGQFGWNEIIYQMSDFRSFESIGNSSVKNK